uniref:Metalloendopeptidase n=1 Tax=Acrobeloides nanus TaxID=290746 RepID=A0A914ECV9_9BILA
MHAIGIEHEHQRPDRDTYIRILSNNVEPGQMINFEKIPYDEVNLHGIPYDYRSIMHYDGSAFGKYNFATRKRLPTMVPLKPGITLIDNFALTENDKEKLDIIGKCRRPGNKKNSTCQDHDLNCETYKISGFCTHKFYENTAKEICKASCGFCNDSGTQLDETLSKECKDIVRF